MKTLSSFIIQLNERTTIRFLKIKNLFFLFKIVNDNYFLIP